MVLSQPESWIGSRYELGDELGRGASGIVYRAHDHESGTGVAVKELQLASPESIAAFKREFRNMADMQHPNLVRVGELINQGARWLLTMELVEGRPVLEHTDGASQMRGQAGYADPDRLRDSLAQLLRGLEELHASGRVHRDVKPSHVLVDSYGVVKLLDFGLLTNRAVHPEQDGDRADDSEGGAGTAHYVSPEQAAGGPCSPASDLYSVGVMLYQAITRRVPFEGPPLQVLLAKQREQPPAPSSLCPEVEPELDRLCMALLATDPDARPDASDTLRRIENDNDNDATRPSLSQPLDSTGPPSFCGRSQELGALDQSLRTAMDKSTVVHFLQGDSRTGKSALLDEFCRRCVQQGVLSLSGRCHAFESLPYKAFDGPFEGLAKQLRSLPERRAGALLPRNAGLLPLAFPGLGRVPVLARAPFDGWEELPPVERRRLTFEALKELLQRITDRRPVVIAIDDLHRSDSDSLTLLRHLMEPPAPPPLLLLVSLPATGESNIQESLERVTGVRYRYTELGALDIASAETLAAQWLRQLGRHEELDVTRITEAAVGHPGFIRDLCLHVARRPKEHGSRLTLQQVIRTRIDELPEMPRRLLDVLAIAGPPLRQEVLLKTASRRTTDALAGLADLRARSLVRFVGTGRPDRLVLDHDAVRRAALAGLSMERRRTLHEQIAKAMLALDAPDDHHISLHLHAAGALERAAEHAIKAASKSMERLAFSKAAEQFDSAVQLLGGEPHAPPDLLRRAALAQVRAGRLATGARSLQQAAERLAGHPKWETKRQAASYLMLSGQRARSLEMLRKLFEAQCLQWPSETSGPISRLQSWLTPPWRSSYPRRLSSARTEAGTGAEPRDTDLIWTAAGALMASAPQQGLRLIQDHARLARSSDDRRAVVRALLSLTILEALENRRPPARLSRIAARADPLVQSVFDGELKALSMLAAGLRAQFRLDYREASQLLHVSVRHLERCRRGPGWELALAATLSLRAKLEIAPLQEARTELEEGLRNARARGDQYTWSMLQMCVNGPICEREGRADAGYSAARQAFAGWDGPGTRWPQFLLGMQAVAAHLQARRPGRASAVLDELERQARKERLGRFPLTRAKLLEWRARIQLSLALGQPRKLPVRPRSTGPLSGARRAINALDKLPTPLAGRAALPLRACLEEQLGDGKAAALTWAQAVAVHTESGQWLHSGLCEIRLAENRKASPRQVQKLMASLQRRGVRTPGALLQAWLPVPDHESP